MATIKSYTDLQQSCKLAEILPLESADMWYQHTGISIKDGSEKPIYFPMVIRDCESDEDIPCWSVGALLEIIKKCIGYSLQSLDTHTVFMTCELGDKPFNIETKNYDNPIDACYEMIIKLNELNLL